MTDLERLLAGLELEWPPTPGFDLRRPARRRRAAALAAVGVAIGIAFAVPPARGAILRFLHLREVSIERVQTLPSAQEQSLAASLGAPVSPADARAALGHPFAFPGGVGGQLYRTGTAVSLLFHAPEPVLLTELAVGFDSPVVVKKFVAGATQVRATVVAGRPAVWLAGAEHVVAFPPFTRRLASNVLLWERDSIVYRLEGASLTLEHARDIAAQIAAR